MKAKSMIRWMIILAILGGMISACNLPVAGPSPEEVQAAANALTSQDPSQATEADIQTAFDLAGQAQALGLDQTAQDLLDWAKAALTSQAGDLLEKSPCEATLEDVRRALELAATAQALPGMEATASQLLDWARAGFQSYAASRAADGADAQERTEMAATAQHLGLDQLAEDLMAGKPIASGCQWQGIWAFKETGCDAPIEGWVPCSIIEIQIEFIFSILDDGTILGEGQGSWLEATSWWQCGLAGNPVSNYSHPVSPNPFDVQLSGEKVGQDFHFKMEFSSRISEIEYDVEMECFPDGGYGGIGTSLDFGKILEEIGMLEFTIPAEDGATWDWSETWDVGETTIHVEIYKR